MKKRVMLTVLLAGVIILCVGCGNPKFNLNDYTEVKISGYEGHGKVGVYFKKERLEKDIIEEIAKEGEDTSILQFAEIIDVSPHYIYEIERGSKTMSIYTLDSVARNLGVSIDYLIYGILPCSPVQQNVPDKLSLLVETIPTKKRNSVAAIIKSILPYVK